SCGHAQCVVMLVHPTQPAVVAPPSSHTSPGSSVPLPQLRQGPPSSGQIHPLCVVQVVVQPSSPIRLPSSHSSLPSATPLPHSSQRERDVVTLSFDGKQFQPGSTAHPEQPSPDKAFPSSQVSPAAT